MKAMGRLRGDPPAMRQRLRATLDLLRRLEPDVPQMAIGFCLGGMAVLEMARDGQDLAAVVSFHGLLETALPADKRIDGSPNPAYDASADRQSWAAMHSLFDEVLG